MNTGYQICEQDELHYATFQTVRWIDALLLRSDIGKLSNTIKEFKSFTAKKILETANTESESRREWMLNLFEFPAKQHKRNEKYQVWTPKNRAEIVYGNVFLSCKSGDLLLIRRSERRRARGYLRECSCWLYCLF